MKKYYLPLFALAAATAHAQTTTPSAWGSYDFAPAADRTVAYDTTATGTELPILWGFDTAWNDRTNMLRGVRHAGASTLGVARVSFQPWDVITEKGVLPAKLQKNLDARMATVALAGKKVDIVLNLDGGDPTIKEVYGGWKYENPDDPWWSPKEYIGDVVEQGPRWADLIDATAAAVEAKGYKVVTASPLNEPDLELNGTPVELFYQIAKNLKDESKYPRFADIRISGGNTLNCDQALPWYDELKEYLDEGNTHQLAGDFDHYADFFARVRADGKYATADELHNVMEAMVGVEYGMQTGIWWGSAEQARGEFMKASFGRRLAYAENRTAWSAASVYRAPDGKIRGFAGCSERQARPSTYNFVSLAGDVFVNGRGPLREYVLSLPGDPDGAYQTELQRNAETMVCIANGADVQPDIAGSYAIINAASHMAVGGKGGSTADGTDIVQQTYSAAAHQQWTVSAVPENIGGDFSYYFIRNTATGQSLDDNNWNIEVGGKVIAYTPSGAGVQQWALEYDGDGWFHIRNKQSALYLDAQNTAEGTLIVQNERSDAATQRWRLLPAGAPLEFEAPAAPEGLAAQSRTASVHLSWGAVSDPGHVTYTVLRAPEGSDSFATIARGIDGTAFVDNTVEGASYIYKVRAEDASGNRSLPSAAVQAGPEGQGLIARFLFADNLESETDNGFSMRSLKKPTLVKGHKEGSKSIFMIGDQWAQLPYSALSSDDFSVAMWACTSTSTDDMRLFCTGISDEECLYLTPAADGLAKLVAVNGQATAEATAPKLKQNEWTHLAFSIADGKATLYVNGKASGEPVDMSAAMPAHRVLTYLGRRHSTTPTFYTGQVEDLRVYNCAITPDEVLAAMDGRTDAIGSIAADAVEVVATEYYNLQGMRLAAPAEGAVTIVRTIYSDGTSHSTKVRR